ncbi:hypothetical protein GOV12_04495 [Candidatus Pacearchaeota archaeon]|nr:hypothetical protein [Candidatus Pacearchaeota archaeon]
MEKKKKQKLIGSGIIILIILIILGAIIFIVIISKQKQARVEGYENCKEELEDEWRQARLMMQKAQDKEIELNDTLDALGLCNNDLNSCRTDLSECQKITTKPYVYNFFNNIFEYSYEEIKTIFIGIFLIIPISFCLSLFKFVFKVEENWFAFFLGAAFILLIILIVLVIIMGI